MSTRSPAPEGRTGAAGRRAGRPPRLAADVHRRRRALAAGAAVVAAGCAATVLSDGRGGFLERARSTGAEAGASAPTAPPSPELPGGGREIFPGHLVVGFYGAPQDEALGALGIGTPAEAAERLEKQARPYEHGGRPVLPAFELIATIASDTAGEEDQYRTRQKLSVVRRYLEAARAAGALLMLDIQPGRSDFMSEVKVFEEILREPDVSLALDPEWHVGPTEIPGQTIGSVDADEVNEVGEYLSGLVEGNDLPQKLLVVHQFTEGMISNRERLEEHPGVALTLNVDGFGDQAQKTAKYDEFTDLAQVRGDGSAGSGDGSAESTTDGSAGVSSGDSTGEAHHGFKLFYEEDVDLMSPRDVLRLRPRPELVVYE